MKIETAKYRKKPQVKYIDSFNSCTRFMKVISN